MLIYPFLPIDRSDFPFQPGPAEATKNESIALYLNGVIDQTSRVLFQTELYAAVKSGRVDERSVGSGGKPK